MGLPGLAPARGLFQEERRQTAARAYAARLKFCRKQTIGKREHLYFCASKLKQTGKSKKYLTKFGRFFTFIFVKKLMS